jgi:hypothetical protein
VLEWPVLLAWIGSWLPANGEFASGCGLPASGKRPVEAGLISSKSQPLDSAENEETHENRSTVKRHRGR